MRSAPGRAATANSEFSQYEPAVSDLNGMTFEALRIWWAAACLVLCACVVPCLSARYRKIGIAVAFCAWIAVFVSSGLRSETLNSDTESYVLYAQSAVDSSLGDYLSSVRLEPGWSTMVHAMAQVLVDERSVLMACALATALLLAWPLRTARALVPLAMLHYLAEFYLNNDLAIIRHSFATALSLALVVSLEERARTAAPWPRRMHAAALMVPPFFHLGTIGVLAAGVGARGSALRIVLQATGLAVVAWVILHTVGATILPERVLDFDAENTREIRGYVHLALLLGIVAIDARAFRSTVEGNPYVSFTYLAGIALSVAVQGFPLLTRIRQVLLEFGILFYPLLLARSSNRNRFWTAFSAYALFILFIGGYTIETETDKYNEGFF